MTVRFHADDYGITLDQARAILALSDACGGSGCLSSVSVFANSPALAEAAALAAPHIASGSLLMGLHANLVEGRPCAEATCVPLLVNERGTFRNDFVALLAQSRSAQRDELRRQTECELTAQLKRYLAAFPAAQGALRLDSHQHTHAIPLVFDALLSAARTCGCTVEYVRTPVEPLRPHLASGQALRRLSLVNLAKGALLSRLWAKNRGKLPKGYATSLFCGVLLSGRMDEIDAQLVRAFDELAFARARAGKAPADGSVEVLFHPVSVPLEQCLDPQNAPFATACAAPGRDAEARALTALR